MSRSGYTGEDGFEIGLPEADARALVAKLLADDRVMWIGLAARDSLRLEAGLCLHGQDITPEIDPASAGLMWAIPKPVREAGALHRRRRAEGNHRRRPDREARRPEARRPPAGPPGHRAVRRGRQAGRPRDLRRVRPVGPASGRHGLCVDGARQARHPRFSPRCAARAFRSTSTPSPSRRIAIAKDNPHGDHLFHRRPRMDPRRGRHRHRRHHRLCAGAARRSRLRRTARSRARR